MKRLINKIYSHKKIAVYGVGLLASLTAVEASIAVTLNNGGTDEAAFLTNNNITKIGELEGIVGGVSKEFFFGDNGSSTGQPQDSADFTWSDATQYNWTLTWNTTTNVAQFSADTLANPIQFDFDEGGFADPTLDKFNAFGLITKVDGRDSDSIESGTTMTLNVDQIEFSNGDVISDLSTVGDDSVSSTTTSGNQVFDKQFYVLSDTDRANGVEITEMTGTFSLDWGTFNPQTRNANARATFELKLFDPPADGASPESTPEPASIISLLMLGAFGLRSCSKKG